ncbi:transcription factor 20 isoform X2 [Clarias gariepinus]|uniref:transcription factor 20 isoform X1 n=1 Tax=Clarias gariepinus TaxID=13013 RepID=UPI00234D01F8|nr:transcription factor 20 isoform X1 [Clarias gariepinus]XP_053347588.1 transcription factor 20 isoform X1 [Clarias gariepinus]XP_053347589.1 transcription factor 20 isoform X1 [Clarias gariepinus]XP_053347590.1 transcription factor 20 isoform X1 [Clarias gariepinus]XP_053347591.1 transcription factor 20 isoform X2 [Clarias gariepinus]
MDPMSRLNLMHLQDPLPKPLDLTKQISEALNLVKNKPRQSSRASGTNTICSPPSSEFSYESVCVPLNTSLPNGHTHTPVVTGTKNGQTDGVTVQGLERNRGEGEREKNGAGFRDTPSSRSHSRFSGTPSSGFLGSGHTECVSSDDSSVIEVPVNVKTHGVSKDKKRKKEERTEHSSAQLIECHVLQDSDSLESRNVASTSEAENEAKNGSSQMTAPATKKTRNKQHMRSSAGKKETASAVKRRRQKKKRSGLSSSPCAFPSHEPEIKLKFSSRKEEKREGSRGNTFTPYVRMQFSVCTVVNYEEDFKEKKQRQPTASPGIVPSTSCLQLGRLGTEGKHQSGELCCLCGRSANAAGLGDLHGPYNPCTQGKTTSEDVLINGHEDVEAKMKRRSDEIGERWVHEDCSIWSAGVFLVKGRLYGLDEALQVAQHAVCSCCHRCGATLGCFFRGCPNKYHFPCALQADCVFNEENFTLRCPKHKNKSGLGASQPRNM